MKFIRAKISNFRILKDIELDFSTSDEKPLTVLRAANESGKTTCENALLWGLYGSEALPSKGLKYPLFPSDLLNSNKPYVEIKVEIEFEVPAIGSSASSNSKIVYRLIRSCQEQRSENGNSVRTAESYNVHRLSSAGTQVLEKAEAERLIASNLPLSLKDIYFTDGDSAMSFIEASAARGVKRSRVSKAVQSLLGIEILESTLKHLHSVYAAFRDELPKSSVNDQINRLEDQIEGHEEDILISTEKINTLEEALKTTSEELKKKERRRDELLRLGNHQKLKEDETAAKKRVDAFATNFQENQRSLAKNATTNVVVSNIYLSKELSKARLLLTSLRESNQLPKLDIPILKDLLNNDTCFCGSDLSGRDEESKLRLELIRSSIERSRESDLATDNATQLFFSSENFYVDDAYSSWLEAYTQLDKNVCELNIHWKRAASDLESIQKKIETLDIEELNSVNEDLHLLRAKISKQQSDIAIAQNTIANHKEAINDKAISLKSLRHQSDKKNSAEIKLRLAHESKAIFALLIDRLKKEELVKVSSEMNRIFLEMIGSSGEENDLSMITKAELTDDFDILVYGPNSYPLNPDQDLNGASRRAITLAFILALTKVSEVEAPNFIDTPLGMMSGFVKQSVLNQVIKEGAQPILFLTHDEIKGVEPIIDKYAGVVFTLTNPAHFPTMLKNAPVVETAGIVRCECNHLSFCSVCERLDIGVSV